MIRGPFNYLSHCEESARCGGEAVCQTGGHGAARAPRSASPSASRTSVVRRTPRADTARALGSIHPHYAPSNMADVKKFTRKVISEKNPKNETVFVIDNVVYDVTKFLDEHPGGHEVLVNVAGKDASEDFDDVGHSFDAKELMQKYAIGELVDEDKVQLKKRPISWEDSSAQNETSFLSSWKFPLLLGILVTFIYSYLLG